MTPEKFNQRERSEDYTNFSLPGPQSYQQQTQPQLKGGSIQSGIFKLNQGPMLVSEQQNQSLGLTNNNQRISFNVGDAQYQPRGIPSQNHINNMEVPLQFPSNQIYLNSASNEQFNNPNYHPISAGQTPVPGFPASSSGSSANFSSVQYGSNISTASGTPIHSQSKQVLPQLNFPSNMVIIPPNTASFSNPGNGFNPNVGYSAYNPSFPELPYQQNRSHSYGSDVYGARHLNWSSDQQHYQQPHSNQYPPDLSQHRAENFNDEDIRVLKSLLFNGERVKWRFISSKLSSVSDRRATATACSKKARELFKLPSEKASGSLGTSLPYVVHNTWSEIVEED